MYIPEGRFVLRPRMVSQRPLKLVERHAVGGDWIRWAMAS